MKDRVARPDLLANPVAVVSDNAVNALRLASALTADGFPCATMVAGREDLIQALDSDQWSAVVIALGGPWRETLDAIRRAVMRDPSPPCVAVVGREPTSGRLANAALRSGVMGIVLEDEIERALGPSLRAVLADQIVAPREGLGVNVFVGPVLSHREKQILAMVARGYLNSQIAEQLYLAESTVKSHLTTIFAKLGVTSRSEAAARVLDPQDPLGAAVLATIPAEAPDMGRAS